MAKKDKTVLEITQKYYQQKKTEENLHQEIIRLKNEIGRMRNSFSWKITLPFRMLRVFFRKSFTFCLLLKQNIAREGGLRNFIAIAKAQIKKFGFSAFMHDFKNLNVARTIEYNTWVQTYDTLSEEQISLIKNYIPKLATQPVVSVVIPVYNPDLKLFHECIQSIKQQLYPHWELCLADDASTRPEIRQALEKYASEDERIKVIFREKNGHISAATNSAISITTSDWIAFLDQDDLITKDALFWFAYVLNQKPEMNLFYSDEDKLDFTGNRCDPHFKSDFNMELLFGYNYINHLSVVKKDVVAAAGGLREGFEGAQDHDLMLRVIEKIPHDSIIHFPKILYHWRKVIGGTALAIGEKSYAIAAGEKALNDYFDRNNINAQSFFTGATGTYETHYSLDQLMPLISIIIPTKNGHQLVTQCINSIYSKTAYNNFEVILIDNNSDEPESLAVFEKLAKTQKNLTVLRDPTTPFNFSRINNNAAKAANGDYLLFLNNDTEIISDTWLNEMLAIAQQPGVGAVGAKLYYPDDTIQHAGVVIGISGLAGVKGVAGHIFKSLPRNEIGYLARTHLMQVYSAVTAACLMISKQLFMKVDGFNEEELQVAFNDVDFCLKLRAQGLRNIWTPYAELYHYESVSRGADDDSEEKIARFSKEAAYMHTTWQTDRSGDPFYNPNMSYIEGNCKVAKPYIDFFSRIQ